MNNQIEIGNRILEMRKKKGLTQSQLAELMNKSDMTISNWECGKKHPHTKTLSQLANILECSEQYLLFGDSAHYTEKEKPLSIDEMILSLSQMLCISKAAASSLFDACLWSMENMDYFLNNCDIGSFAGKANEYMYYCTLDKDSNVLNRQLLEMQRNNALMSIMNEINKAAASCNKNIVNLYKGSIFDNLHNDAFLMPNISFAINRIMRDSKLYDLMEQKQKELLIDYLVSLGNNRKSLLVMDRTLLIGKALDEYWNDTKNNEVKEYKSKGSAFLLYNGDDMTEQLRQYANELFDTKIAPALSDYLSNKIIAEYKDAFLESIDINNIEFNYAQIQ